MVHAGSGSENFRALYGEDLEFSLGWTPEKAFLRIQEIKRFATFNSEAVIPLVRRRRIARLAEELLTELDGLGVPDGLLDTLHALAGSEREWRCKQRNTFTRGGDRRSGDRTLEGSILGMIVRLYCEAHERPTFSKNGPVVRFANAVGEHVLGEANPFTSDAVKAEFRRMKPKSRRMGSLRILYKPNDERGE
jgi:hypothetical protein